MPSLPHAFLQAIAEQFPKDFLSTEASELLEYGRDWTRVVAPNPSAIAFPRSTSEVSTLLALCHAHRVPVVPSGGRTGLAGGAVAASGELVVSLKLMNRIGEVDLLGNTLRVQAGAVTEAVHQKCAQWGLTWPVDFASKGSSQVGGNIATNAGGVKVIRYGLTRNWVLGLQVVTAEGHILELNGALEKNNTGLDLRQLFIGSEGTLGVLTEATLKLCALPKKLDVLLFAVPDLAGVLRFFREARQASLLLSAFEFFTHPCLLRLQRHRKLRSPFENASGCYVLMEVEDASSQALDDFIEKAFRENWVQDGTLAQSLQQARDLWTLREGISESLSATGMPHKNDIALPVSELEAFTYQLDSFFEHEYPDFEICIFGHIGDGNLHVNIMKPEAMEKETFLQHTSAADVAIFELVKQHHGSISAEHGIGLLKKKYLNYSRSREELALMKQVKASLDPRGILNPGKIFDIDVP